jgi:hypothetical protein
MSALLSKMALISAFLMACAGRGADSGPSDAGVDGGMPDTRSDGGAPLAFACSQQFGQGVCEVMLNPASLGPGIEQVRSMGQNGRHYACRPEAASSHNGRLLVHLVGTGSDPARDHRFVQLGCALGFAGVAPMYENADDARSVCGDGGQCYEAFHREVVAGGDHAPMVSVDAPNSVLLRLGSMLDALAPGDMGLPAWAGLRDAVAARNWTSVAVSGHSQGSGHALYLSRELRVERVVMLSGINDRIASGTPANAPAPWVAQFPAVAKTPASRALGFVHTDDSLAVVSQLFDNWDRIGLGAACDWASPGGYAASCRRIVIMRPACSGPLAHSSTVFAQFGLGCVPGGSAYSNQATWRFLLSTPLP